MSSSIQTPYNLLPPSGDALVDLKNGMAQNLWDLFFRNEVASIKSLAGIRVSWFGADFKGQADSTGALQHAVNTAVQQGGGIVFMDQPGTLSINTVTFPTGKIPILLMGLGEATAIKRRGTLVPGKGMLDVLGSNVAMRSFVIDGATTKPTGLIYSAGFNTVITMNDPMAPSLTNNTSIWVHGNTSGFQFEDIVFQHAAGYSLLLDAMIGDIHGVRVSNCLFINNRPTLFGTNPGNLNFGSWNGGLLIKGDGRTATAGGVVSSLRVSDCQFERNTGNCVWSHLYGLKRLHADIRIVNNGFLDCGLDAIEMGGVIGGEVSDNNLRRVGYITLDDTSRSTPRWLANFQATAIDSAGIVTAVNYNDNEMVSINGGCLDMDGHGESCISGNTMKTPSVGEPSYDEDQIAITGPNNNGSQSYGINTNNTNQTPQGAADIEISGNQFINLVNGSVRLYSARRCHVVGNAIKSPINSSTAPVIMGPVGTGPYQRCYSNKIHHNQIEYDPASPAAAVVEDDSIAVFLNTEQNSVFGNCPITGASPATEFSPSVNSGSVHYAETVWFP